MSMLTILAAALEQELLMRGVTAFDRDDCHDIIKRVMAHSTAFAESVLEAKAAEKPEPWH
jgi:hypothetical protein